MKKLQSHPPPTPLFIHTLEMGKKSKGQFEEKRHGTIMTSDTTHFHITTIPKSTIKKIMLSDIYR
jgi:hypothetical protein